MPRLFVSTQETRGQRNCFINGTARHEGNGLPTNVLQSAPRHTRKTEKIVSHRATLSQKATHCDASLLTNNERYNK